MDEALKTGGFGKQPIDDQYMRKLVSRTVKESAADFWYEIRVARPNITWEEIKTFLGKDLLIMLMHK